MTNGFSYMPDFIGTTITSANTIPNKVQRNVIYNNVLKLMSVSRRGDDEYFNVQTVKNTPELKKYTNIIKFLDRL